MTICNWFNNDARLLQNYITKPEEFINTEIPNNYYHVLSSLKTNNNDFQFNLFNDDTYNNESVFIGSHRYLINFSKRQHRILTKYFLESTRVYDLCVDIWKDYKDVTTNWQVLKESIFKYLYREQDLDLSYNDLKITIINELKKKYDDFIIENEKNQEIIQEQKRKIKEKFSKEMMIYKEKVKLNKKSTIKEVLIKPKMEKIKIEKVKIRKPRGENIEKPGPDDTLKGEIRDFCRNLSNAKTQAFHDGKYNSETKKFNDDAYELKYKNTDRTQTISISDRALSKDGIFIKSLKKLKCDNYRYITEKYDLNKECKLQYDKGLNKYYLYVVFDRKETIIDNRKEVVAIDEGEKTFATYYSNEEYGKLGDNMRIKILNWQKDIKKLQSVIDKKTNKQGEKLRNVKRLKLRIRKLYLKIKGYVNEVHKKSAKYLCENYKHILLPEFKTKPMISKGLIKREYERIKELNKEEARIELKKLNKRIRLSNNIKFVLSMQSHYKFKEYLKATASRYRTKVYDVDESFTSQCCTMCGTLSNHYDNRVKHCENCDSKIDRDINGSRNILIKCVCEKPGVITRLANL